MILCLDAGNTRLKFGLHDGRQWLLRGALASADVLADSAAAMAQLQAQLPARPVRLHACNVAGAAMQAAIEHLAAELALPPHWLRSEAQALGVRNGYARPDQLGHDRWAGLIAARRLHPGACVVVMAGTATTVDALAADGLFRGGFILPGLALMRQALAGATAQLPLASGDYQPWPDNTGSAIVSGSLVATAGAIEYLRRQLGGDPAQTPIILSGGAGEALLALLAAPVRYQPDLVLDGLLRHACAQGDAAQCKTFTIQP